MPAPPKEVLSELAKAQFRSKNIHLPTGWSQPGDQFEQAFEEDERQVDPDPAATLFKAATRNKYHVETARIMSEQYEEYIDGMSAAICTSIGQWMKMAQIAGVVINGAAGMLLPGCVTGPLLTPLILSTAPRQTAQETRYSHAIANALAPRWQAWHLGLSGTLFYPPFAAMAVPLAAPIPNVPLPLAALSSSAEPGLAPESLRRDMTANLDDPKALHAAELFEALSKAFNTAFQTFKSTTLVQNVFGTGPVPVFAPPGPVVAGTVIPAPGILI